MSAFALPAGLLFHQQCYIIWFAFSAVLLRSCSNISFICFTLSWIYSNPQFHRYVPLLAPPVLFVMRVVVSYSPNYMFLHRWNTAYYLSLYKCSAKFHGMSRALGLPKKRMKILRHLKQLKPDIALLQETHLPKEDFSRLQKLWV